MFDIKKFEAKRFGIERRRPPMLQPDLDVQRLLSVERAERLRADALDRNRRRGAFRRKTNPRDRHPVARPAWEGRW
ncbi:MAG TPA: hypothetical protein VKA45_12895 [Gaiellaceae bacterium]|nr:hypothetical protein [Gaiellaceae bacterium]